MNSSTCLDKNCPALGQNRHLFLNIEFLLSLCNVTQFLVFYKPYLNVNEILNELQSKKNNTVLKS